MLQPKRTKYRKAHKGHALELLMLEYDVAADELLVFGDFNNDLEMLALAEHSYAMANAHPNVLAAARHRTLSNDDRGVEHVLERIVGP